MKSKVFARPFPSSGAHAAFMLSTDAPPFTALVNPSCNDDFVKHLGVVLGEPLFSDDITALRRAAVNWDKNKFAIQDDPVTEENRRLYPGCVDGFALVAAPHVPYWFLEEWLICEITAESHPTDEAREAYALMMLCRRLDWDDPLEFYDRDNEAHAQYFREVAADPKCWERWE